MERSAISEVSEAASVSLRGLPRRTTMGPMLFSPAKGETERLLDYGTTRAGDNKPWHPAARFATGALVTVFAVRVPASSDETDAAPRACVCPTLTVLSRPPYSQTLFIFAIVEAPYEGIGEQGTFATSTKPSSASLSGHDDAPKSQPVAVTPAAAVARVGIQTRENAVARRDRCAGMGSNATVCAGTNGCETWRGECQVQCNTLATEDACGVSAKCQWDDTYHTCNSRKLPTCTSSNTRALCIATRFCEWDAIEATCGDATWRCEDLKDAAHCSRSDSPRCVWSASDDDDDADASPNGGTCSDLRQCEAIALPQECPTHHGCAFSQSKNQCISLSALAGDKPVCRTSADCDVPDTFCNGDYGPRGFCQNCLPIIGDGIESCDDIARVPATGAKECRSACFPPKRGGQ